MTPTPPLALRVYRVLLFAGGAMLVGVGGLYRWGAPELVDPTAGRLAVGLAALSLGTLTFTSDTVRRHAIALVYGLFALASAWQIWAAATAGLTPTESLALLLVFTGCSAGIQSTRLLAAYSVLFVGATAASLLVSPPTDVPHGPFLATLSALGALGVYLSHTRHQALRDIQQAREDALEAARVKSEFLAAMSHEIRTPLNGVIGMTDVLASTPLSQDQRDSLDTIQASGRALLAVINDVLDFSKIEAGRLDLESEPVDLRAFADDAVSVVAPSAGRAVEVVAHVEPGVPRLVLADGARLRQVVLNLLSNAVKFTERGTVALRVGGASRWGGTAEVTLRVSDTGIGIPAESLGSVFDSFVQVDASTTRRFGGTGLGLAISRSIAERMGGTISVESVPGQGSTFSVTVALPVAQGPPPPVAATGAALLLVDRHDAARESVTALAARLGLAVQAFATADQATAWVEAGGHYDLAALDLTLNDGRALALAQTLRAHVRLGGRPLVLLSPVGSQAASPALFDAVLTKPVRADHLADAVARLTGQEPLALPEPPAAPVLDAALRVLVVEDNAINRTVAVGLLRQLGVVPELAEDGAQALDAVAQADYDLVLMDVQMPVVDGLDATRQIRARGGRQPRVVALTANALPEDTRRCLAAGMDAVLTKPVRLHDLRAEIERTRAHAGVSHRTTQVAPPASARPAGAPGGQAHPERVPSPAAVAAHLRELCDGDGALAAEILDAYLGAEAELTADLAGADPASAAHKLRAACATLGADALAHALLGVESRAESGRVPSDVLDELAGDLGQLRRAAAAARQRLGVQEWATP